MLKILHSADWHMDAPMRGFSTEQRLFLRQKMHALPDRIAQICIREKCDLVLLAGDIFDSFSYTEESLDAVRNALKKMNAPVFVSPGNHDYYCEKSPWFRESWPDNVYIFDKQEISAYRLPGLDCRVYGGGFTAMDCPGLLEGFSADCMERYALMVLHGDPSAGNSSYCPVTAAQVRDSGLDYVALGHIHAPGQFGAGAGMCAWPGCPMGHGYDETGTKGILIAELETQANIRFVPLGMPCFWDLSVDAGSSPADAVGNVLAQGTEEDFFRIRLTGESDGIDLPSLLRQFSSWPNLKLLDETVPCENLWDHVDEDSFEGIYFRLLREGMEQSEGTAKADHALAAKISRQILMGREVELP